jgi:hypothetical protein
MAGIDEITHVVVLMLENHSFDHLLGFLPPGDPGETIDGLTGNEAVPLDPQAAPTDLVSEFVNQSGVHVADPCFCWASRAAAGGPPRRPRVAGDGFRFDRLGVRVPAVLVSPWVGRGKVAHATFDHTSLLATVKKIFGLPDFLTRRDAAANTFEDQLLTEARKTEDTPATLSALVRRPRGRSAPDERGLSDHQRALVALSMALDAPQSEHHAALEVTPNGPAPRGPASALTRIIHERRRPAAGGSCRGRQARPSSLDTPLAAGGPACCATRPAPRGALREYCALRGRGGSGVRRG